MNQRLHVQHVVLSLQPGGLENGVVNLVNRLPRMRFQSSICCLGERGAFAARVNSDVAIHQLGWNGGNDPALVFRLARLFRTSAPDIVHTRNAESFYYGFVAARLAGISTIVHSEHGRSFDDRAIRLRVQRWFSRHTHGIFAVSQQLKADLVRYVGLREQSVQVLYNGVDTAHFGTTERESARCDIGIHEAKLMIGSVGRLAAVKNHALLINAIARLNRPEVTLMLVGDGPERQSLEALVARLRIGHQVRFVGHRDDVAGLLAAMDIFVLPSVSEGLSNTLLEAMASGVACVASDVGGNAEIVAHEQSGYLFASDDVMALTGYLDQLCSDAKLRDSIGAAGRRRVEKEFSIDAMISRYEGFYRAAATRGEVAA